MSEKQDAPAEFEGPTDPDEPFTLRLLKPIENGSEQVTELVFQPMSADIQSRIKTSHDKLLALMPELVGLLAGQPKGVVGKLKGRDWARAQQVAQFFFASGLETGTAA